MPGNIFSLRFFCALPNTVPRILKDLGPEKALDEAFDRVLQQQGLPTPDRRTYDLDPLWGNLEGMAKHNNLANFAAGLPPQVRSALERYAQTNWLAGTRHSGFKQGVYFGQLRRCRNLL